MPSMSVFAQTEDNRDEISVLNYSKHDQFFISISTSFYILKFPKINLSKINLTD